MARFGVGFGPANPAYCPVPPRALLSLGVQPSDSRYLELGRAIPVDLEPKHVDERRSLACGRAAVLGR